MSLIPAYAVIQVRLCLTTLPQNKVCKFKFVNEDLHNYVKIIDTAPYINYWYFKPNSDG